MGVLDSLSKAYESLADTFDAVVETAIGGQGQEAKPHAKGTGLCFDFPDFYSAKTQARPLPSGASSHGIRGSPAARLAGAVPSFAAAGKRSAFAHYSHVFTELASLGKTLDADKRRYSTDVIRYARTLLVSLKPPANPTPAALNQAITALEQQKFNICQTIYSHYEGAFAALGRNTGFLDSFDTNHGIRNALKASHQSARMLMTALACGDTAGIAKLEAVYRDISEKMTWARAFHDLGLELHELEGHAKGANTDAVKRARAPHLNQARALLSRPTSLSKEARNDLTALFDTCNHVKYMDRDYWQTELSQLRYDLDGLAHALPAKTTRTAETLMNECREIIARPPYSPEQIKVLRHNTAELMRIKAGGATRHGTERRETAGAGLEKAKVVARVTRDAPIAIAANVIMRGNPQGAAALGAILGGGGEWVGEYIASKWAGTKINPYEVAKAAAQTGAATYIQGRVTGLLNPLAPAAASYLTTPGTDIVIEAMSNGVSGAMVDGVLATSMDIAHEEGGAGAAALRLGGALVGNDEDQVFVAASAARIAEASWESGKMGFLFGAGLTALKHLGLGALSQLRSPGNTPDTVAPTGDAELPSAQRDIDELDPDLLIEEGVPPETIPVQATPPPSPGTPPPLVDKLISNPRVEQQLGHQAREAKAGRETEGDLYYDPNSDRVEIVMGHDPRNVGGATMNTPVMAADDAAGSGSAAETPYLSDTVPSVVRDKMRAEGLVYGGHFHLTSGNPVPSTNDLVGFIQRYRAQGITQSVILKPGANGKTEAWCELSVSGDPRNPFVTARFSDPANTAYARAFRNSLNEARRELATMDGAAQASTQAPRPNASPARPGETPPARGAEPEIRAAAATHDYLASLPPDQNLSIGRGEGCTFITGHDNISGKHCQIRYETRTNTYFVMDMGSTNGTFVNGERIAPREWVAFDPTDPESINLAAARGFRLVPFLEGEMKFRRPGRVDPPHPPEPLQEPFSFRADTAMQDELSQVYRRNLAARGMIPSQSSGTSLTDLDREGRVSTLLANEADHWMSIGPGNNHIQVTPLFFKIDDTYAFIRRSSDGTVTIEAQYDDLVWIVPERGAPYPINVEHGVQTIEPGSRIAIFGIGVNRAEQTTVICEAPQVRARPQSARPSEPEPQGQAQSAGKTADLSRIIDASQAIEGKLAQAEPNSLVTLIPEGSGSSGITLRAYGYPASLREFCGFKRLDSGLMVVSSPHANLIAIKLGPQSRAANEGRAYLFLDPARRSSPYDTHVLMPGDEVYLGDPRYAGFDGRRVVKLYTEPERPQAARPQEPPVQKERTPPQAVDPHRYRGPASGQISVDRNAFIQGNDAFNQLEQAVLGDMPRTPSPVGNDAARAFQFRWDRSPFVEANGPHCFIHSSGENVMILPVSDRGTFVVRKDGSFETLPLQEAYAVREGETIVLGDPQRGPVLYRDRFYRDHLKASAQTAAQQALQEGQKTIRDELATLAKSGDREAAVLLTAITNNPKIQDPWLKAYRLLAQKRHTDRSVEGKFKQIDAAWRKLRPLLPEALSSDHKFVYDGLFTLASQGNPHADALLKAIGQNPNTPRTWNDSIALLRTQYQAELEIAQQVHGMRERAQAIARVQDNIDHLSAAERAIHSEP